MSTVVVDSKQGPGCLLQILYFFLIGWWLGQIWIAVSWFLMLTIIGIPIAVMMMNRLPQIIALRGYATTVTVKDVDGTPVATTGGSVPQHNIFLRAIYFVLIGWWFSAIWMEVAYIFCMTIILLPVGFWMFDQVPAIVSLHR